MKLVEHTSNDLSHVAVVAIGRNEGERLERCLESLPDGLGTVVYVDSGSTDGSVDRARALGAEVVELDMSVGFTAARARNAGVERILQRQATVSFVQVIDGDCELDADWIALALDAMCDDPELAVACGRRRERSADASRFNRLVDMEWDTPVGEARACGGDALIRMTAFADVGGLDETLIAGEEPEFCLRLRRAGWRIRRLDADMTLHDADMHHLSQWWRRNKRSGHAYAEWHDRYGRDEERFGVDAVRSIVEWAVIVPVLAFGLVGLTWGASLLLLGGYGVLYWRIRQHRLKHGDQPDHASLYARYCILGKAPQLVGMCTYWANRLRGRRAAIIEYKSPTLVQRSAA